MPIEPRHRDDIATAVAAYDSANPKARLPRNTGRLLAVMFPSEDVCQRSLEDIASEGFDRRSIYPTLRRLLDAGLLSRQLGSGRSPNTYRLHLSPGGRRMMTPLSHLLPPLPGFTALSRTYAPWPVWSGSTTTPIRFAAMPKKAAIKLWHRARDFDRGTHQPGRHGGALGHTALAVLHTLIFDFLNHRTGRLDPSYAAIAAKAGVCVRTVASALPRLKALGILNWVRRCAESWQDGRFVLEQETNAYAVLPESQWRGYRPPQEPPAPWPGTWGDSPPLPSALAQATLEGDLAGKVQMLASDPKDRLAAALARLGQAFMARNA